MSVEVITGNHAAGYALSVAGEANRTARGVACGTLEIDTVGLRAHKNEVVDKLTGVYLSGTLHREDQPSHVHIHDQGVCVEKCYSTYGCPCTRFCPGDVYEKETRKDGSGITGIKLNFTNCLHCKTCDIKDPYQIINWVTPEGGSGPNYQNM